MICKECQKEKSLSEFIKNSDTYVKTCKECIVKKRKITLAKKKQQKQKMIERYKALGIDTNKYKPR